MERYNTLTTSKLVLSANRGGKSTSGLTGNPEFLLDARGGKNFAQLPPA